MQKWYQMDSEKVLTELHSRMSGLTQDEAEKAFSTYGENKLQETKKDLADNIINGDNVGIGSMSKDDIMELLGV